MSSETAEEAYERGRREERDAIFRRVSWLLKATAERVEKLSGKKATAADMQGTLAVYGAALGVPHAAVGEPRREWAEHIEWMGEDMPDLHSIDVPSVLARREREDEQGALMAAHKTSAPLLAREPKGLDS